MGNFSYMRQFNFIYDKGRDEFYIIIIINQIINTFHIFGFISLYLEMLFNNHWTFRKLSRIHPAPIFILSSVNYYNTDFNHLLGPRNGRKNYWYQYFDTGFKHYVHKVINSCTFCLVICLVYVQTTWFYH